MSKTKADKELIEALVFFGSFFRMFGVSVQLLIILNLKFAFYTQFHPIVNLSGLEASVQVKISRNRFLFVFSIGSSDYNCRT